MTNEIPRRVKTPSFRPHPLQAVEDLAKPWLPPRRWPKYRYSDRKSIVLWYYLKQYDFSVAYNML